MLIQNDSKLVGTHRENVFLFKIYMKGQNKNMNIQDVLKLQNFKLELGDRLSYMSYKKTLKTSMLNVLQIINIQNKSKGSLHSGLHNLKKRSQV